MHDKRVHLQAIPMHEMSLAEEVLLLMEEAARREGFARVITVWLEIGQFASVEVDAMRFCFDAVTRGSLADGATLEIIAAPGTAMRVKELEVE